jgi:hypothetical protein
MTTPSTSLSPPALRPAASAAGPVPLLHLTHASGQGRGRTGRTRAGECPRTPEASRYRSPARNWAVPTRVTRAGAAPGTPCYLSPIRDRAVPTRPIRAGAARPNRRRFHLPVRRPVAWRSEGRLTGRGRSLFAPGVISSLACTQPERFRRLSSGRGAAATRSPEASFRRPLASGRIGHADCGPGGNVSVPTAGAVSSLLAGPRPGRSRSLTVAGPGADATRPLWVPRDDPAMRAVA